MATAPELATLLKELRARTDLTQADVSRRAGLSENYYGMIENERRRPSGPALQAILGILPCTDLERARAIRMLAGALFPDPLLQQLQGPPPRPRPVPRRRMVRRAAGAVILALSTTGWGLGVETAHAVESATSRIPLIGHDRRRRSAPRRRRWAPRLPLAA